MTKSDILEHNLVPEHVILSDEEVEKVLDKYNMTEDDIPKILANDPVVKAIGAKVGDILEITRNSETAGIFVAYRIVRE